MNIRRIKIWLSRGWFHVVSLTSLLMLLCIPSKAQQNNMDSLLRRLEEFSKETGVKVERIEKGHDYVDLGLSIKWATCNIGADKPEDYGDYYAWGELQPKDVYSWETYKYCDGSYKTLTKYTDRACGKDGFSDNKSVLDPEDDVAHVKWGGNWRIPTKDELEELRTQCTWTITTLNGVKGYTVTSNVGGYTDRSIFMPATGMRIRQWTLSTDTIGRFWGNSIEIDDDSDDAVYLDFNFSRGPGRFTLIRCFGQCVRPVCP